MLRFVRRVVFWSFGSFLGSLVQIESLPLTAVGGNQWQLGGVSAQIVPKVVFGVWCTRLMLAVMLPFCRGTAL